MTDDLSKIEDRLGRALSGLASTTAVSPDGWDLIDARTSSRRRLPGAVRFGVPALAVALVVVLLAVVAPRGDDRPSVVAGPAPAPRAATARFAPQGLSAYTLESAGTSGGVPVPGDASAVRVYGHRADDAVRLDAVVLVVTARSAQDAELLRATETGDPPPSPLCATSWPTGCLGARVGELTARGQASAIMAIEGGFKVAWDEPGGPTVGLLTRGVPQEALATIVDGIRLDGDTAIAEALPNGFVEVHRGIWPAQPMTLASYVSQQAWATANPDDRFTLVTFTGPGLSLDTRAWLFPDTPALGRVHGEPALIAVEDGSQSITWQPQPGVLLVIFAMGRSNDDLEGLAEAVRELDEARWRALMGGPGSVRPPGNPAPLPTQGILVGEGVVPGGSWRALLNLYSGRPPAVCIDTQVLSGEAHGCADVALPGSSMAQPQLISFAPAQGGNFLVVPIAKSVYGVRFTQSDGTQAALPPMRTSGTGFEIVVIQLGSAAPPDTLVALDSNGREVARQDLPAALAPPAAPPVMPPPVAPPTPVPATPSPPGG